MAGVDAACILDPQPYHLPPCTVDTAISSQSASDPLPMVFAHPIGCILHNVSQQQCEARADRNGRFVRRARSAAECAAHGCGCEKPTLGQSLLRSSVIGPPADATSCASCSPSQKCTPYATWTAAQWRPGAPRQLVWKATAEIVPAYAWRTDAFDFTAFGAAWDAATSFLYSSQATTAEQCRFNRIAAALEAVSCGCGPAGNANCYADIDTSLPIGVGSPCADAPLTLIVPPHTFDFTETSVTPSGSCLALEFFSVPRSAFASIPRGQTLSTYFTNFDSASAPKDFEFRNSKGAVVGQVIGDAVRVVIDRPATTVTVCLNLNTLENVNSEAKLSRYPILDIAVVEDELNRITPLNLNATVSEGGLCATLSTLEGNICTRNTYEVSVLILSTDAPVIRLPDWDEKNRSALTAGEKVVFYLCAGCYLAVLCYAMWHLIWIVKFPSVINVLLTPPLWLCVLFAIASSGTSTDARLRGRDLNFLLQFE